MNRLENQRYSEELNNSIVDFVDWSFFNDCKVVVTGATGLIGTYLIDLLMLVNEKLDLGTTIIAIGRSETKARERLPYFERPNFHFIETDVSSSEIDLTDDPDCIIHLASSTHPKQYSKYPISTITSNVFGLNSLLNLLSKSKSTHKSFVFASSVEIYGENRGDVDYFTEDYLGYLNCCTLRAGYPEAKRLGEALCLAYAAEKNIDIYIPRIPRTFGPTMLMSDTKASSQFIKNALEHKDIVLKSQGTQQYSYLYVADTVLGILTILTNGHSGQAYNLADKDSDTSLRDFAMLLAQKVGTEVIFDLPSEEEAKGYSTATKALMDASKIKNLGWKPLYNLDSGVTETLGILRNMNV